MNKSAVRLDLGLRTQQEIEARLGVKLQDALSRYTPEHILHIVKANIINFFPRANEIIEMIDQGISQGYPVEIYERLRSGVIGFLVNGKNTRGKLLLELRFDSSKQQA